MKAFVRLNSPPVLTELDSATNKPRWISFGERYKNNRERNPGFRFNWPNIRKVSLNAHILPTLRLQTQDHCSYCDGFPLKKGENSIDHFLPKSKPTFYTIVCQWTNLYLACTHCQDSKVEKVNPFILRPDNNEYLFSRFFVYNYILQTIEINPLSSAQDQKRAAETIQFFDFNHTALIISRRHAFERYNGVVNPIIDDFNFRFMFE
ncbi:HNH endonuclease [Larkinella sp.]|uniref:HNH endonuclease n=1 Tax=Larkinella sp. TaxID=2034517 RepID=UPI003BA906BA